MLNRHFDEIAKKNLAVFLADAGTFLAVSQNPPIGRFWSFGSLIYTLLCAKVKKNPLWYIFLSQSMFLILVPYYCPILITLPNDQHACLALPTLPLSTHPFDCSLVPPSQGDKRNQRQLHLLPEVENHSVSRVFRQFKMAQTWLKKNKCWRI